MTVEADFTQRLVEGAPELTPLVQEHLADQEGELLPYLLMADVAGWAHATYPSDPEAVGGVVDWLEDEYAQAATAEKDLIGLGFVEAIPYRPDGAPLLMRLGPELTQVAAELGLMTHPTELG